MSYRFSALAGCLVLPAVLMTGCATKPYVPTLYDAETASVGSIALADDAMPEKLGANELATSMGLGQATGGLIGGLVVAAMEGAETLSRVGKLNEMMEPLGLDFETEFETMLTTKLASSGYGDVQIVGGKRDKRGPLKAMPETTADAILDVHMTSFGMQKAQTGQEWRPAAGVDVRLVSVETDEVLMENVISYNSGVTSAGAKEGIVTLYPAATSTGYMKIKEMDPAVVAEEIRAMLDDISDTVVSMLQ